MRELNVDAAGGDVRVRAAERHRRAPDRRTRILGRQPAERHGEDRQDGGAERRARRLRRAALNQGGRSAERAGAHRGGRDHREERHGDERSARRDHDTNETFSCDR